MPTDFTDYGGWGLGDGVDSTTGQSIVPYKAPFDKGAGGWTDALGNIAAADWDWLKNVGSAVVKVGRAAGGAVRAAYGPDAINKYVNTATGITPRKRVPPPLPTTTPLRFPKDPYSMVPNNTAPNNVTALQTGYNGSMLYPGSNDYGYPSANANALQTVADAIGAPSLSMKAFVRLARAAWQLLLQSGLDPGMLAALLLAGLRSRGRRRGRGLSARDIRTSRRTIRTIQSFSRALHLGGHRAPRPQYAFQRRRKR